MTTGFTICFACKRFRPFDDEHASAFCMAFPAGIPDDLMFGGFDHRQPHEADRGIRFELDEGRQASLTLFEDLIKE